MKFAAALLGSSALALAVAPVAYAQTEQVRPYDVPAQPLGSAVSQLSEQAGIQLVVDSAVGTGVRSNAVQGSMTVSQALQRMLAGTGLAWRNVGNGTITIERGAAGDVAAADGERVLGAVRVEGSQGSSYYGGAGNAAGVNGINGSRDITATEGTGSFTSGALSIGSKSPQALKDVAASISVQTSEVIEQRNINDLTDAMRQLPGITLVQGETSNQTAFFSRGFEITNIQIDGGAPISTKFQSSPGVNGYFPQIDLSIYDHVELQRGSTGLLSGQGDPGGVINLVRKKPLDHAQYGLELQAGSWSNYRLVADATSPLAFDGKLRGRLVITLQDRKFFYDTAKENKTLVYGVAELDVTPTTLLRAGMTYTRQDTSPWQGGLPRFSDGGDLDLPRSTCLCFGWNRWDFETTEAFGAIEQKLGGDWLLKLNVTGIDQSSFRKVGYSRGSVNPNSVTFRGPTLFAQYNDYASKQFTAEAVLNGSFMLFGQRQELVAGVSRSVNDAGGNYVYSNPISGTAAAPYIPYAGGPAFFRNSPNGLRPPINVFDFDPNNPLYNEPRAPLPTVHYRVQKGIATSAYLNLRLTAFDRLHLTAGLRWEKTSFKSEGDFLCTDPLACPGGQIGDPIAPTAILSYGESNLNWPPTLNLSFDFTRNLVGYVGYADIYIDQSSQLTVEGNPLRPARGTNWEAGVKWAPNDGRLNVALSAYSIDKTNIASSDPSGDFYVLPDGRTCCAVDNSGASLKSKGIDLEVTGQLLPGLQVSASWTYGENKFSGPTFGPAAGLPFLSLQPKHSYRLWATYDFGAAGPTGDLSGLSLSVGINGQSSGYNEGTTCLNLDGPVNEITGAQGCALRPDGTPDFGTYRFNVEPYTLLSGRIDYRLSDTWSMSVNLENIFDKKYYQTTATGVGDGHWYGAPRSVTATIRAKW